MPTRVPKLLLKEEAVPEFNGVLDACQHPPATCRGHSFVSGDFCRMRFANLTALLHLQDFSSSIDEGSEAFMQISLLLFMLYAE